MTLLKPTHSRSQRRQKAPEWAVRACGHRVPVGRSSCPWCSPPRLSIKPLSELVRARTKVVSLNALSVEVASRLQEDPQTVRRYLTRVVAEEFERIEFHTADRYAIALGEMPASLWGSAWDDASPVEPYGDEEF